MLGFATPADVDAWLLANPYKTTGAVHFSFTPDGALGYGLQTNSTVKNQRGIFEDGTFDYQVSKLLLRQSHRRPECPKWPS